MTDREVMQMALNALEHLQTDVEWQYKSPTRTMLRKVEKALRTALAQPEPEPVAWKLVPIQPTNEMLKAMDECSTEGYDERLYAGHAASVYMAAVDVAPTPPQHESTCAECDKKQSDGWALYCVDCLREFYKHDPTNKREWVNLTVEERETLRDAYQDSFSGLISAVQMLLKDKNT